MSGFCRDKVVHFTNLQRKNFPDTSYVSISLKVHLFLPPTVKMYGSKVEDYRNKIYSAGCWNYIGVKVKIS